MKRSSKPGPKPGAIKRAAPRWPKTRTIPVTKALAASLRKEASVSRRHLTDLAREWLAIGRLEDQR